jgi:hypothetical protein
LDEFGLLAGQEVARQGQLLVQAGGGVRPPPGVGGCGMNVESVPAPGGPAPAADGLGRCAATVWLREPERSGLILAHR